MKTVPPVPSLPAKLFKVGEAADTLGVSRRKLWRLIGSNQIQSVRVGARGTRISAAALGEFMDALPSAR